MADPQTVHIIVNQLTQRNLDDIAEKRVAKKQRSKPTPPTSPKGGGGGGAPPGATEGGGLSAEEKRVARALGVPFERYKAMKKLGGQG